MSALYAIAVFIIYAVKLIRRAHRPRVRRLVWEV